MPGLFDKIKSGAESARFEAERMVRLNQAQSALGNLKRDLDTQATALGQQVLALYDAGTLQQAELVAPCQQLDTLRQQISEQIAQVERIKQEKAPAEGAPAPVVAAAARSCPQCGAAIGADTRFCPNCGTNTQVAAQPAGTMQCPSCHSTIAADVAFCPECGARTGGAGPRPV